MILLVNFGFAFRSHVFNFEKSGRARGTNFVESHAMNDNSVVNMGHFLERKHLP